MNLSTPPPVTLCTQYVPGTGLLYYWDRNKERRVRARELLTCKSGGGRGEIRGRERERETGPTGRPTTIKTGAGASGWPSGSCLPAFQVEQKGEEKGEENKGEREGGQVRGHKNNRVTRKTRTHTSKLRRIERRRESDGG